MPHDPAYQLFAGRASQSAEEIAWDCLRHPTSNAKRRYGANRFDLTFSARVIVQKLEKIAREKHWRPGPFSVAIDASMNKYLDVKPAGMLILEISTGAARRRINEIRDNFAGCDIHPYFALAADMAQSRPSFRTDCWTHTIEGIADAFYPEQSRYNFFNHPDLYEICDNLNLYFADFYLALKNLSEAGKSFHRIPTENRRRLMQYAYHLMDAEPQTLIAHLTIRRDMNIIGGGPAISREMTDELRTKLIKHLKHEIPANDYLGHAILLKRDATLGCWLEAFVFFTKNALVPGADLISKLVGRWNGEFGPGHAGCAGEILFEAHAAAEKRYRQTLERIVLVTEPDFYCRVSADGLRRFWCTQSPIGKLAERTKQTKRREAQKKTAANAPSTPMSYLQENAPANHELLQRTRFIVRKVRHAEKLSERNQKAAKKRSPRKSVAGALLSAQCPTYMMTINHASITAAKDAAHVQDGDASSSSVTAPTNMQPAHPPTVPSLNNVLAPTAAPERAIHRKTEATDGGRKRVQVEIRKKRTFVDRPKD